VNEKESLFRDFEAAHIPKGWKGGPNIVRGQEFGHVEGAIGTHFFGPFLLVEIIGGCPFHQKRLLYQLAAFQAVLTQRYGIGGTEITTGLIPFENIGVIKIGVGAE
jgi:hypothetical protein